MSDTNRDREWLASVIQSACMSAGFECPEAYMRRDGKVGFSWDGGKTQALVMEVPGHPIQMCIDVRELLAGKGVPLAGEQDEGRTVTISAKEYEALVKLQKTVLRNISAFATNYPSGPAGNLTTDQAQAANEILQTARAVGEACKPPTLEERAVEVCRRLARLKEAQDSVPAHWLPEAVWEQAIAVAKEDERRADK